MMTHRPNAGHTNVEAGCGLSRNLAKILPLERGAQTYVARALSASEYSNFINRLQ